MSYAVDNRFCVHIFMYFDLDDHLFAVSRFGFLSYACRFVHVLQARSEESLNSILRANFKTVRSLNTPKLYHNPRFMTCVLAKESV